MKLRIKGKITPLSILLCTALLSTHCAPNSKDIITHTTAEDGVYIDRSTEKEKIPKISLRYGRILYKFNLQGYPFLSCKHPTENTALNLQDFHDNTEGTIEVYIFETQNIPRSIIIKTFLKKPSVFYIQKESSGWNFVDSLPPDDERAIRYLSGECFAVKQSTA